MLNIFVASNPFGYGPTGTSLAILRELKKNSQLNIFYLASKTCLDIIEEEVLKSVTLISINERDESEITKVLEDYPIDDTVVIGVQNRFIINCAKNLCIKSYFVDVLGWMWDPIPPAHLLADNILWTDFPNINIPKGKGIKKIGAICDFYLPTLSYVKEYDIMVSIGGCINPLTNEIQKNYLELVGKIFQKIQSDSEKKVVLTLGDLGQKYLILTGRYSDLDIMNTKHLENLELIRKSHRSISNGGQTFTFEVLSMGEPFSFTFPSNLSMIKLIERFSPDFLTVLSVVFEGKLQNLLELSEKESILMLEEIYGNILSSEARFQKVYYIYLEYLKQNDPSVLDSFRMTKLDGQKDIAEMIKNEISNRRN